jgi:hypothetical protein
MAEACEVTCDDVAGSGALFLALPTPLLERILGDHCNARTVAQVAAVCRALHAFAGSDGLWLRMCQRAFQATDPRLWLVEAGSSASAHSRLSSFR